MKTIPLTKGKVAIVDDADYAGVVKYKWYACQSDANKYYARRYLKNVRSTSKTGFKNITLKMQDQLMGVRIGFIVDHRDGDGLNNQRHNLRWATETQNAKNKSKYVTNTSGFIGVRMSSSAKKWAMTKPWRATIGVRYKNVHLGYFASAEEAAKARDTAAEQYFGEFAKLNFPKP